ncbi:MAG: hypothetical protein Q9169_004451 [Polycauliona sp. 2 TL-2023]
MTDRRESDPTVSPNLQHPATLIPVDDNSIRLPDYKTHCLAVHEVQYCREVLLAQHKLLRAKSADAHQLALDSTVPHTASTNFIETMDSLVEKSFKWTRGIDQLEMRLVLIFSDFRPTNKAYWPCMRSIRASQYGAEGRRLRMMAMHEARQVGTFTEQPTNGMMAKTAEETLEDT